METNSDISCSVLLSLKYTLCINGFTHCNHIDKKSRKACLLTHIAIETCTHTCTVQTLTEGIKDPQWGWS